jgi:hypothetical protein
MMTRHRAASHAPRSQALRAKPSGLSGIARRFRCSFRTTRRRHQLPTPNYLMWTFKATILISSGPGEALGPDSRSMSELDALATSAQP